MAASTYVVIARVVCLVTLASLALALAPKTQLPERLQPYLHLINHTYFERAHSELVLRGEWQLWKRSHNKRYPTDRRDMERFAVWKSNKVYIDYHNQFKNVFGYNLAMNQFGDLSAEEYLYYTKCIDGAHYLDPNKHLAWVSFFDPEEFANTSQPVEINWRSQGIVSDVKNQGRCRSCYAFAITGALESMNALATKKIVQLSEQNIVDCSIPYGNRGCSGGSRLSSLMYIIDSGGLDTETTYPYFARQSLCQFSFSGSTSACTGMVRIHRGMESDLETAVGLVGPVTVGIDSKHYSFQFYQDGIYDEPECSSENLTHTLLVVGYGTDEYGKDYWLLKNSWGKSWGKDGYIKMTRNSNNQCGIASQALFPLL
ncbi:procathepsin L-like [Halichondria panicea]|uniref:procathepsin L-like n=1 Tax=Halichondria panicea TaxID=6063 RepID=UPI00312B57E8